MLRGLWWSVTRTSKAVKITGLVCLILISMYFASQTTFNEIHNKLVEDFESTAALVREEREEGEEEGMDDDILEIEATPAMLLDLRIPTDEERKGALVDRFVEWARAAAPEFESESALFRDIDLDVLVAYKNRLEEQKALLPAFEKHRCEEFRRMQERPTRMNVYYDRPVLRRRGDPMSDKVFREKLAVCYQVYAPSSEVVREHATRFYDAVLRIAIDARMIDERTDGVVDPNAFHRLDARVKNNLVHRLMQLSEECHRHLAEIESTIAQERLLEAPRLLDYETDSVLIRPAQDSPT
jgi:hypothetical protein